MLHMKEEETIDTFTEKLTTLVNKAASLGHTIEDQTLVRKLLNAVPDRYLQIVTSIEQYSDLSEMTLEEAIGRLKTYEERIKYKIGKQVDNQEILMFTRHENKGNRFMQEPQEQHMKAIRQVLRYIKGTKDYGITYKHNRGNKIYGFSDSSYGVNTQEGKGTIGIIFYYGESPISWSTQKQAIVALSSCESEFIAATAAATQALWLKRLLSKLTYSEEETVTIKVDSKSSIALMKNLVFYGRSKHIDTKYQFIRECVEREGIQVEFISGEYQKADILKKAPLKIKFLTMGQLIGLKDLHHNDCD
nr:ribonuclease H-like domain, reverse transcriptase, RNA-dependent DNA polymerase [Tanacetum cinerariifolium]